MPSVMRPQPRPVELRGVLPDPARSAAASGVLVTGITHDSRDVQPGDVYAALPGRMTHGARFAAAAVALGAVAVVTDATGADECGDLDVPIVVLDDPRAALGGMAARVYGEPARDLVMIGITGTNGKTTVATMVESGLRAGGRRTGMVGTVGVTVDGVRRPAARTTPEATDLQAILAVMRDAGVEAVVMEVSSIAIEEGRVDGIRYDVAAFTNLTQDHLDYHGSMERYFAAKSRLFTAERAVLGIIGVDDAWGAQLAAMTAVPHQTWSLLDPHADWHAVRERGAVSVIGPEGERQVLDVPLPGSFNVANAVCAYAVLRAVDVAPAAAAGGISGAEVPGRMQVVGEARGVRGIVDYAHSPDAIERVLRAARDVVPGRVIAVLGAGGDRDTSKRPLMGSVAARLADVLVITDDNPRSEDPAAIRQAVHDGALQVAPVERSDIREVGDRSEAITVAVSLAEAGDVVLVLGKGHEQGQEAGGIVTPFDDATVLRAALEARSST